VNEPAAVTTVGQVLRDATARLAAVSDSPRLDAEVLAAFALGKSRGSLFAYDRDAIAEPARLRLLELIEARARHVPVAYLTGYKEFWTLRLRVTPDVLVPRPDTELLVEWALSLWPDDAAGTVRRVVDLGTGSGAIALALACERPAWQITGTDASQAALAVARGNAESLALTCRWCAGAWWAALDVTDTFDLVVSNPPYIADGDTHLTALAAEPRTALTAGADGLDDLRVIIAGTPARLRRGGWLLVEHGHDQGAQVRALFDEAGFADVQTRRDLGGNERATAGHRP